MSSSTEHQVVKSLASLAYEVRHSTSFRTMLQHLTERGRGDVLIAGIYKGQGMRHSSGPARGTSGGIGA